ncbi:MAG: cystathionine gamma-synthase [Candidatus Eiseniibacteriota bacterium]|nr:MAG: cystathionine gamma-synthase [Candidatus Eisenbacteria bacterium]
MRFSTKAIHVGQEPDASTGAVVVPVHFTSTYAQESPGQHRGYEYSRTKNPTRHALEECAASLENGKHGLAFASGMAAINNVLNLLKAGDHVVSTDDVYGGTYRIFDKVFRNYGLKFSFVDTTNPSKIESALEKDTKMLWAETPSNPLLRIVDLREVARISRERGLTSVVDNTFATPYFQLPLQLGIDIVVHSTTKYLGGHSDVVGGLIVTSHDAHYERLAFCQNAVGGVPGPMDSWLVLRGLKTLGIRMKEHFRVGLEVARFLESHPRVKRVLYPWLPSHPQHDLAKRQMSGMSGMISFEIDGELRDAKRFLEKVKLFTLAESLGGVESLIEHPAIMTHASVPPEVRAKTGISDSLIRLSVGIEDPEDLIQDLASALG